ncbi:hypothetical protein BDW62DRAFT_204096 [Aspergillus aurantiobrunneus]
MALILLVLLALASSTAGNVVTTNVSSPFRPGDLAQCFALREGLIAATTAAFTSNYSDSLFTWTESFLLDSYDDFSWREYSFGYEPSSAGSPFQACTLFFNDPITLMNVTADGVHRGSNQTKSFPDTCATDLTANFDRLAREAADQSDQDVSAWCRQQKRDISDYDLDSCAGTHVSISDAIAFTIDPSQPGNCTANTDKNYNFRSVTSTGMDSPEQIVWGVTPVITIFFPAPGANLTEPETHYSALRSEKDLLPLVDGSGASNGSQPAVYFVLLSWLMGVFLSAMEFSGL